MNLIMELFIQESGKKTYAMVKEFKYGRMGLNTKVTGKMTCLMGKVASSIQMAMHRKVNG